MTSEDYPLTKGPLLGYDFGMRYFVVFVIAMALLFSMALVAQQKTPPQTLTFKAMPGNVAFNHAAHVKAANNKCATCHPALFKQDAAAPLNFKAGMHKPAEAAKTSCGGCHHTGGTSFETKGNCAKCHKKGA